MAPEVAAIVLAAGRATRFAAGDDDSKVLAQLGGRALVSHVVAAALASRARPVIVVTGQGAARCAEILAGLDVRLVHNAAYVTGMASSLASGLAALPREAKGAMVLLADMPLVCTATMDALVTAFLDHGPDAVIPTFEGRRGNPVVVARSMVPTLAALSGDEGARRVLAAGGHRVLPLAVEDPGVLTDVDTRDALALLARGR